MKTIILAPIRCCLMFTAVASLFWVQSAHAYTITLEQVGSNVVGNGNGAINLTGLSFEFESGAGLVAGIQPNHAVILPVGGDFELNAYSGFTGPANFGSGGFISATTSSGDPIFLFAGDGEIFLPTGYVSGSPLSDGMTFSNATFATLGVTPGTYVWTWGTGLPNQNFTLVIGGAGVPDGGSTVSLLGCALLGLAAFRRKLGC
jgi:VPDSG-CTERM motif